MDVSGTELEVFRDIEARQKLGIEKYGMTVATNPAHLMEWLQHAYEEALDQAIYLKRAMRELEKASDNSPLYCSPCPDCEDTGWVGDQEAGSGYRNGRRTKNDEWQPCGCDRHELAKRKISRANDQGQAPADATPNTVE